LEIYNSEQEQVEALRKWWKENGMALILGLVLGIGGLFGYRGWQDYRDGRAEEAAELHQQALTALGRGDLQGVSAAREQLQADYATTPYPPLAVLAEAKAQLEAGDAAAARERLGWVVTHATQVEVADVARLRLARLALTDGDDVQAQAQIDAIQGGGFKATVDELQGDIQRLLGDSEAARVSYAAALAAGTDNRVVVGMKLDELGGDPVEMTQ